MYAIIEDSGTQFKVTTGDTIRIDRQVAEGDKTVTFDKVRLPVPTQGAQVSATATFSDPGEYMLRVQANDESGEGGGGFQCCWTNTYVKVTVTP